MSAFSLACILQGRRSKLHHNLEKYMTKTFEPWATENEDSLLIDGTRAYICEIDPRVETNHSIGQLPVPKNPPPPVGWEYWRTQRIPPAAARLAVDMLHGAGDFPMGAFVRIYTAGQIIGARVEWHNIQGATGKLGCFRGVNLMRRLQQPEVIE